ncbi:MAG TPA: hypothetical protein VF669_16035 [Tepidisphaeraceae bacterium]|jgi:hypothetical protein
MNDIDLSEDILKQIERKPREQVTCRRVSTHHYRCNWWAPQSTNSYDNPAMLGMLVTTSRICQSRFLRVVKDGERLTITDLSSRVSAEA